MKNKKELKMKKVEKVKINMIEITKEKIVRILDCNNMQLKMNKALLLSMKMKILLKHLLNNERFRIYGWRKKSIKLVQFFRLIKRIIRNQLNLCECLLLVYFYVFEYPNRYFKKMLFFLN